MSKSELRLFIVAVALMTALGSCTEQVQPDFADKSEAKIFTATIEQGITKTLINESLAVEWESNDRININGAVYAAAPGVPATTADFVYVDGDEPQPPYKAFYPSSMVNEDSTYTLPSTQKYVAGRFRGPMYAESDTERLTFANICGVLCLSLTGTDAVSRIQLTTVGEPVCGNFEMTDDSTLCMKEDKKSVYLECGEAGVQLDTDKPTKFFFFLPPQTYAPGMEVTIIGPDGKQMVKNTSQEVVVKRNTLYSFDWDVRLLAPEAIHLFGRGNRRWLWHSEESNPCWGHAPRACAEDYGPGNIPERWWGVDTPEKLLEWEHYNAGNMETLGKPAASAGAYMVFDKNLNVASYSADGTPIASSTYSIENYDSSRSSGWELGKLVTAEPAVLWPFSFGGNGKTVTEFDIMYLDANNLTLVYSTDPESWTEITFWKFKNNDYGALTNDVTRQWTWNVAAGCWGNAGAAANGEGYGPGVVDGQWWGVATPEELLGQLIHAKGNEETLGKPAASPDAYMEISANGRIASYGGDGEIICSSTYEVRRWDPSRDSSGGWELGKLVTAEPVVLFPFSINEDGTTVNEFDIMYLDAENMTLVNTKGNGPGSWGEITYWKFKAKN